MENIVIVLVLAAAIGWAAYSAIRHFRGEGGCCSGGTYKARPRKLNSVAETRVYRVEGMSCQHCINRVTEAVHDAGRTSARVNLRKGTVTVAMEQPVDDEIIIAALERAGYAARREA